MTKQIAFIDMKCPSCGANRDIPEEYRSLFFEKIGSNKFGIYSNSSSDKLIPVTCPFCNTTSEVFIQGEKTMAGKIEIGGSVIGSDITISSNEDSDNVSISIGQNVIGSNIVIGNNNVRKGRKK